MLIKSPLGLPGLYSPEMGSSRLFPKHYAIISAEKRTHSAIRNEAATANFFFKLQTSGLLYIRQDGVYKDKAGNISREVSFLIFDISYSDAEFFANQYKQEAFIWDNKLFDSNNGNIIMRFNQCLVLPMTQKEFFLLPAENGSFVRGFDLAYWLV